MIKLLKRIHHSMNPIGVAVSGGIDSMAALTYLMQYPKNDIFVLNVHHGTAFSETASEFVADFCAQHKLKLVAHKIASPKPLKESWEEYWRNCRYRFFHSYNMPVITAHNLDDNVETWLFGALHGRTKLIPYSNRNVIRPFMLSTKEELKQFLINKNIGWLDDPSNNDVQYMRNLIRHNIIPEAFKVNPGLYKVIRKKLIASIEE